MCVSHAPSDSLAPPLHLRERTFRPGPEPSLLPWPAAGANHRRVRNRLLALELYPVQGCEKANKESCTASLTCRCLPHRPSPVQRPTDGGAAVQVVVAVLPAYV